MIIVFIHSCKLGQPEQFILLVDMLKDGIVPTYVGVQQQQ